MAGNAHMQTNQLKQLYIISYAMRVTTLWGGLAWSILLLQ